VIEAERLKAVARELCHDLIVADVRSYGIREAMIASCLADSDATEEDIEATVATLRGRDVEAVVDFMLGIAQGILTRGPLARRDRWEDRKNARERRRAAARGTGRAGSHGVR
jgi:hypothetical protein